MILYVLALLIGVIAGLRAMTAPAAVSWAASLGFLNLEGTWLAFLGYRWTPWIMTVLAIGELIGDQLPTTPSRKTLMPFATRIIMGGLCGGAIAVQGGSFLGGLVAGARRRDHRDTGRSGGPRASRRRLRQGPSRRPDRGCGRDSRSGC